MRGSFFALLKKDFRLMASSKFFLLALGSLILYSCYTNFVYVKIDQEIFPVYQYGRDAGEEPEKAYEDGYSVVLDFSSKESLYNGLPVIKMVSCGSEKIDNIRTAYAVSKLFPENGTQAGIIGENSKEMKNRREIAAEFLFFELTAVGFLGLAAMLFEEKQMGVIRVHAVLPIARHRFILSKLLLILLSDLLFCTLLTAANLGITQCLKVLPAILLQAGILSLIMALVGFFCAVVLPDFKQFSLLYLVLAVFITTPVFLAGQTGAEVGWIRFHPMYHLFMAMKNAYFGVPMRNIPYYLLCASAVFLLFLLASWGLEQEMKKEG